MSKQKEHPQVVAIKTQIKEMREWLVIVEGRELYKWAVGHEQKEIAELQARLKDKKLTKSERCELKCHLQIAEKELVLTKQRLKAYTQDSKGLPYG